MNLKLKLATPNILLGKKQKMLLETATLLHWYTVDDFVIFFVSEIFWMVQYNKSILSIHTTQVT